MLAGRWTGPQLWWSRAEVARSETSFESTKFSHSELLRLGSATVAVQSSASLIPQVLPTKKTIGTHLDNWFWMPVNCFRKEASRQNRWPKRSPHLVEQLQKVQTACVAEEDLRAHS